MREVTVHLSGRVEGGGWSDVCYEIKIRWRCEIARARSAISISPGLRPAVRISEDDGANVTRERRAGAVQISKQSPNNLHIISTQSPGRSGRYRIP